MLIYDLLRISGVSRGLSNSASFKFFILILDWLIFCTIFIGSTFASSYGTDFLFNNSVWKPNEKEWLFAEAPVYEFGLPRSYYGSSEGDFESLNLSAFEALICS